MVKVVNIFKAAGLWVGTIFLLYGATDVERQVATQYYGGFGTALAPSRSAEAGTVIYGKETGSRSLSQPGGFDPLRTEFPRKGFGSRQGHSVSVALRTEFPEGGFVTGTG